MPKIIEDIKEIILSEAKRQVLENGYSHTTIRSVAKGAGIAVGTIYNYYSSKDVLVASFMLTDWMDAMKKMREGCENAEAPMEACQCIWEGLLEFYRYYSPLFQDADAQKSFDSVFHERHKQLRGQLAGLLAPVCEKQAKEPSEFLPEFLAEALLSWTSEGQGAEEKKEIELKLFAILEHFFRR